MPGLGLSEGNMCSTGMGFDCGHGWAARPPEVCMGGGRTAGHPNSGGDGACTEGPMGEGAPFPLRTTQQSQLDIGEGSRALLSSPVEGGFLREDPLSFLKHYVSGSMVSRHPSMSLLSCHGPEPHVQLPSMASHGQEERLGDRNGCLGAGRHGAGTLRSHQYQ